MDLKPAVKEVEFAREMYKVRELKSHKLCVGHSQKKKKNLNIFKGGTGLQEIKDPNRDRGMSLLPECVVLGWL